MTTPARVAGLYGRRPPKRAPAIAFSAIRRRGAAPAVPAAVDYLAGLGGGWAMLGNGPDDSVYPGFPGCGDCVPVWWANTRRVISKAIGGIEDYPGWADVLAVYQTQNPDFDPAGDPSTTGPGSPADGGMDIQTLLEYLAASRGPDGSQLIGFAAVDYTNAAEVRAAIDAGGVLCAGITVLDINQSEFSNDQPWDYVASSAADGGHCVVTGGYGTPAPGSDPALAGDQKFITWAAETSFTDAFWSHEVEELWFPVWAEQLGTAEFQAGVDLAAFAAEYTAITGRPFPGAAPPPAPPPAPAPVPPAPPAPVPVPPAPVPPAPIPPVPVPPVPPVPVTPPDAADLALADAVGTWPDRQHVGGNEHVARALRAWLIAKGLVPVGS